MLAPEDEEVLLAIEDEDLLTIEDGGVLTLDEETSLVQGDGTSGLIINGSSSGAGSDLTASVPYAEDGSLEEMAFEFGICWKIPYPLLEYFVELHLSNCLDPFIFLLPVARVTLPASPH